MGRGSVVGLVVGWLIGLALALALTYGPPLLRGAGTYELVDTLVYLGAPLVLASGVVGALVGARWSADRRGREPRA